MSYQHVDGTQVNLHVTPEAAIAAAVSAARRHAAIAAKD